MSITTTIPGLGTPPSIADPANFDTRADTLFGTTLPALVTAANTWGTEANALAASMNAVAAGTFAIPYTFSTTTTDSDPGPGELRLDNATQNAATTIRLDLVGSDGETWTNVLDIFDDSTSTVKGYIMLQGVTDGTKFIMFSVSALASPTGYKNITVAVVASSDTNPFSDADDVVLKFTRTGDKGETGATGGSITLATPVASTSGTSIDFTSIPSGTKRVTVHFQGVSTNGVSSLLVQLGDSGGIENTGYIGNTAGLTTGTNGILASTAGFAIFNNSASNEISGQLIINLADGTNWDYTACGNFAAITTSGVVASGGRKTLSAELDRIRVTTVSVDTFDNGEINISYE